VKVLEGNYDDRGGARPSADRGIMLHAPEPPASEPVPCKACGRDTRGVLDRQPRAGPLCLGCLLALDHAEGKPGGLGSDFEAFAERWITEHRRTK
jgi:hypothetical protein